MHQLRQTQLTKTARKLSVTATPLLHYLYWISLTLFLGRINWLAPLGGDGWFHIIVVRNGALHRYINSYLKVNPRIGEFFTTLSYASDWHGVVINTASVLLLVLLIFAYLCKRLPRTHRLDDWFQLNIILALLWLCLPLVGLMFFFNPFVTNYLLGFAFLMLFALPYYRYVNKLDPGVSNTILSWILLFLGGIVAGMSNEHTVPAVLIILSGALIWRHRLGRRLEIWQWIGMCGLLLGYLLLYFAPGQGKRYGGEGQHLYDNLLEKLSSIPELISRLWSLPGILSLLLGALLLYSLIRYFIVRRETPQNPSELRQLLVNCLSFLVIAHISIAILFISPRQGDKLFMGPVLLMIMAFLLLANYWLMKNRIILLIAGVTAILVNGYFAQMIHQDYQFYRQEFDQRMDHIVQRKQAGERVIYIQPYKTQWNRYIWGDDTGRIRKGMPAMGVYFDVDRITYAPASQDID